MAAERALLKGRAGAFSSLTRACTLAWSAAERAATRVMKGGESAQSGSAARSARSAERSPPTMPPSPIDSPGACAAVCAVVAAAAVRACCRAARCAACASGESAASTSRIPAPPAALPSRWPCEQWNFPFGKRTVLVSSDSPPLCRFSHGQITAWLPLASWWPWSPATRKAATMGGVPSSRFHARPGANCSAVRAARTSGASTTPSSSRAPRQAITSKPRPSLSSTSRSTRPCIGSRGAPTYIRQSIWASSRSKPRPVRSPARCIAKRAPV